MLCGAACQELCLNFPLSSSACALEGVQVFSGDSEQMQDAGAAQPCSMSPPPHRGIPGQERGCKMNHSCNMSESTWSLWRSLKTLRLWQAGPGLLPKGPGLAAAGGRAVAMRGKLLQDKCSSVSGTAW